MKSKFIGLSLIGLLAIAACGPTQEEKAAADKKVQDSIAAAKVQMEAAMAAARQQLVEDSIAVADSVADTIN